jgi:RND family efflux transporter MFP subunit
LYSAQIEYLQASKTAAKLSGSKLASVTESNRRLMENSRQRLIELGMTAEQIATIEKEDEARSRMDIVAPMSGTVIEKVAVEGEYVKEGQPIFKLADLSTVWLMLELFPADAAVVCNGQTVEAKLKSLPGRTFTGRVTFIDPDVDPQSRTVSVRVVMDNRDGILRIGDYAKATITVQQSEAAVVAVPRNAVLMAADHCVVYVETDPGRFEIRRVETGDVSGDEVVIVKGLSEGEAVATNGNFLLDSQMQLAGNPSLIDPTRAATPAEMVPGFTPKMLAEIDKLPEGDRQIALEQVICPVTDYKLGSMGVPPKVTVNGQTVFLCCEGCRESLLENVDVHLEKLRQYRSGESPQPDESLDDDMVPPLGDMQSFDMEDGLPSLGEMELVVPAADTPRKPNATDAAAAPGRTLK